MGIYKVLKDFPSRNGVEQYKLGETIHLDENSRTKALAEMGYIEKNNAEMQRSSRNIDLARRICHTISKIRGVSDVSVTTAGTGKKYHLFCVKVEEK